MLYLIQKIIPHADQTQDPEVRTAYGRFSSIFGIVCNLFLFAGKLAAGLLSGSLSITADAVNNLSDASGSIISLLGFHMAGKPADDEHPFGHGRYEYLSGLLIALIIIVIGFELLKSSVTELLHPSELDFNWLIAVILVASIAVKLWMMRVNMRIGKLIQSQTLLATAADSRNDVISTAAVLIASLISEFTSINLDGWMGLLVASFILYSGIQLVKDTLDPLLGCAPDPKLTIRIHDRIMQYPEVLGVHDLIIHDYGPGRQFASVHVEMAAENDVFASHDVTDNIERDLRAELGIFLVVHFDPISTKENLVGDMRQWLAKEVLRIDPQMTIHDLRIVPGTTHTNLIFDCVAPRSLSLSENELKKRITALVQETYPTYHCVITVDHSFISSAH